LVLKLSQTFKVKYNITNLNVTTNNVTIDGNIGDNSYIVSRDKDFTAKLEAISGYELPKSITVKVGEEELDTTKYTYSSATGEILIAKDNITEDITISANGLKEYPSGTSIKKITGDEIIWVKEEAAGQIFWFGIDNSNGNFVKESYFWVRVIDKDIDNTEWSNYYQKIDEAINEKIKNDKLLVFEIGVTNPNGEEYTVLDKATNIYVQYPDDWSGKDIKSIYISASSDESVFAEVNELNYDGGRGNFIALTINHFSPYAIYEEVKSYKVIFDANDGIFSNGDTTLTFENWNNEEYNYDSIIKPTRNGYKFLGYYTEKTGGTTLQLLMAEVGIDSDMTFYAQWEEIKTNDDTNKDDDENINTGNTNTDSTNTNNNTNTNKPTLNNPQTGDNIELFTVISIVAVVGIMFVIKVKKYSE